VPSCWKPTCYSTRAHALSYVVVFAIGVGTGGGDTGDMYPLTHGEEDKPRIYSCPPQSHAYASSIYHSKSTQGEKGNLVVHNSRKPFGDRGSSTEPAVELQRSPAPVAGEEGAGCPLSQTPLPLISIPYMQTVCNT